jgi:hypothetical protein
MISVRVAFPCILLCIIVIAGHWLPRCYGQAVREPPSAERLLKSVADYEKSRAGSDPRPSQYMYTFVRLSSENRPEAVVFLQGEGWCGTGGCTTLVLARNDSGYKIISHIPATPLPIRLLKAKSHGWHNLAVWTPTDGVFHEELLVFDGARYWWSSSDVKNRHEEGKVILSSKDKEAPLRP